MKKESDLLGDVLARLRAVKHCDLKQVGLGSGVPEGTLRKLYYGEVSNPRILTVQALHNFFARTTDTSVVDSNGKNEVLLAQPSTSNTPNSLGARGASSGSETASKILSPNTAKFEEK